MLFIHILKSLSRFLLVAWMIFTMVAAPYIAHALPSGLQVQSGSIDTSVIGNQLQIDQLTPQAIANWESFSIGSGQRVNINQLNEQSVLLNRVMGANPSKLLGQLNANGRVFLINPNGVVVGPGASISTAEFLASTLNLSDEDFLNGGDLHFAGDSLASVVNFGSIKAANGDVILLAYRVVNAGEIEAGQGVAALGAGSDIVFSPESNQRILIKTGLAGSGDGTGVDHSGVIEAAQAELKAAGGNVYELAINQSGLTRATGIESRNGRVLITADGGTVGLSGSVRATNADGSGGEVLLGGDYRGGNAAVANAARTFVAQDGVIDVSAESAHADAGRAIVWAEEATRFLGTILGQGGRLGGDGAFAEVSGKRFLDFQGFADLTAPYGKSGQLLLDPASLTIQLAGPETTAGTAGDPFSFENTADAGSVLTVATLEAQLALSDVRLLTSAVGDMFGADSDSSILVSDAVSWTSGNTLEFNSAGDIIVNANLNGGTGDILFGLGFENDGAIFGGPTIDGKLVVDASATVTAHTATIQRFFSGDIIGNSTDGFVGAIDINGIINVDTLDIQYAAGAIPFSPDPPIRELGGIAGVTSIDNPLNQIGTLRASVDTGSINNSFTIVDGSGGLIVDGQFKDVGGDVTIVTTGDLTLTSNALISTAATRQVGTPPDATTETADFNINLAAQSGAFINNAGAGAVEAKGDGRFLIYSDNPADTNKGGLVGNPVYDKRFATDAPATITQTGDRFLYSLAPTLRLTANNTTKTEGDPNPVFTFSTSGLVGDDQAAEVFSGLPTLSTTADTESPVGPYFININQGTVVLSDFGYSLLLSPGVLSVEAAALQQLIITANDLFRIYGDPNPEFTARYDGFTAGQDESLVSGLSFNTTATLQSPVGNYTITPFGAAATGFNIIHQPGTLQIEPRLLTVTANNTSRNFGDTNPDFTFGFANLASFDNGLAVTSGLTATSTAEHLSNVGNYAITIAGTVNTNYTLDPVAGNLQVTPRPITVTAQDASREFGDANPTFSILTGAIVPGAPLGTDGLSFDTLAIPTSDVGNYVVTPSGIINDNYAVDYRPGKLAITAAPLIFSANPQIRQYGLANASLTFTDATNYKNGDTLAEVLSDFSLTTTATQGSNIGSYLIDLAATVINDNYAVTLNDSTLTIQRAPLTVAPALSSRLYGDPNPTSYALTAIGLRNGDTEAVVLNPQFENTALPDQNAFTTSTVSIFSASAANYNLSFTPGTMNILPRPLTITADSFTREYGEANPTLTADFDGLASFDTESVITGLTLNTIATPSSIPQDYGILANSNANPNYAITYVPGTLQVTKAPLVFSLGTATRVYGNGNDFALSTVSIQDASGFKFDDGVGDVSLTNVRTTATQQSDVGNYPIMADAFSLKYEPTIAPGVLEITRRPLTAALNFGTTSTRFYGDPNIDFASNLLVGNLTEFDALEDVLTLFDPTNAQTSIGEYAVTAVLNNANYSFGTLGNPNFFIQQRSIDVVFAGATRLFGDANPDLFTFLANTDFLALGDSVSEVLTAPTTNAVITSDVGDYAISTASINSNYFVNSVTGNLSITPRPLFINLSVPDRIYGNANPERYETFRTKGGAFDLPVFATIDDVLTVVAPAVEANVGEYTLSARDVSANYSLQAFDGTINILPRPLAITADDLTREYGDPNPTFTADFVGLASFDSEADIANLRFDSLATPASDVLEGGYAINVASDLNPNYTISYVSGRLTIAPAPLLLGVDDATRFYGRTNPAFGIASTSGFKLDDGLGDLSLSFSTLAEPTSGVGDYTINASAVNPNYAISFDPGTLSITPAPLAAQILSIAEADRVYGEDPGDLSALFQVTGFQFAERQRDVVRLVDPTDARTPIGVYAFETETLNPNYEVVSFTNSGFRIGQRVLDLVFAGATRAYGDPNPDLFSFLLTSGLFAPGEAAADVLATPATSATISSTPGSYAISTVSINPNYRVNSITGNLSVTQRMLDLVFSGATRFFGEPNPDLFSFLQTDGLFVFGNTAQEVLSTPSTTAGTNSDIGSYPIQTVSINPNYRVNSITGDLAVVSPPTPSLPEIPETDVTLGTQLVLTTSGTIDSGGFQITEREPFDSPTKVTIRGTKAPGLASLFANGDYSIGVDMIQSYFESLILSGQPIDTSEGSLFFAIMGSSEGTPRDFSAAQLEYWLSQNIDKPETMALLAEPLTEYSKTFLLKDPARYTENDTKFVSLLSEHMGQARDGVAASVEAEYQAWLADPGVQAQNAGVQSLFGSDVPWADFLSEGAAIYVDSLTAESAVVVGSSGAAGVALSAPFILKPVATALFPFVKAMSGKGVVMVAGPVAGAVVMVAVVSTMRGMQLLESDKAEALYNEFQGSVGSDIEVAGFSLKDEKGEDDAFNQAIMFGAIASMLLSQ